MVAYSKARALYRTGFIAMNGTERVKKGTERVNKGTEMPGGAWPQTDTTVGRMCR